MVPQEVLTKDSVTVSVDAVVYYRVSNATVSVANVENAHHSTRSVLILILLILISVMNLCQVAVPDYSQEHSGYQEPS